MVGAHDEGPVFVAVFAHNRCQRTHLDRIAQCRTRAMRFDIVDIGSSELSISERSLQELFLCAAIGCGETRADAVLLDGDAMDQGMDRLRMNFSITDAAKDERAAAFGSAISIRVHVEGMAMAGRRCHCSNRARKCAPELRTGGLGDFA